MKETWNQRYSDKEYIYGRMPNDFLKNFIDNEPPGKILLPGDGEGRNAVYAAKKGWQVHAVDYSEIGRQKALSWAAQNNVEIEYEVADLVEWNANLSVDCVAIIYAHFNPEYRQKIHHKLIDKLVTGGYFVMEVFSKKQIDIISSHRVVRRILTCFTVRNS